jgi:hypothetical protein
VARRLFIEAARVSENWFSVALIPADAATSPEPCQTPGFQARGQPFSLFTIPNSQFSTPCLDKS